MHRFEGMTAPRPGRIRERLIEDHEALDRLLARLTMAFRSNDWKLASDTYADLERELSAHFRTEEELLFPEFCQTEPREAADLLDEHRAIRARVFELGVGIDLHQTRLAAIEELVTKLRRHAEREDALLYRWADRDFSDPARVENVFAHGHSPVAPVS
jgi:hemerythrin